MKNKIKYCLIFFVAFLGTTVYAQDNTNMYSTANGVIQITAVIDDTTVVAQGRELHVILNYENAAVTLQLDLSTLTTGNTTLDSLLALQEGKFIVFTGALSLDYINTGDHPPQEFEVKGTLSCDPDHSQVEGEGILEHIYNGWYSSVLEMTFYINLSDIGITPPVKGMSEDIQVEISESILNNKMD